MTRNTIKRPAWTCLSGAAPRPLALVLAVAILALLLFQGGVRAQGTFDPVVDAQLSDYTCGVNADVTTSFSLAATDYNYKELVSFTPAGFFVAAEGDVPLGGVAGQVDYLLTLGLLNGPCNTALPVAFTMADATTDTADTVSFEDGFADANANGLPDAVDKYPDFLNTLFPGITPRARYYGDTSVAGSPVCVNLVIFQPGVALPGLPVFDPGLGYPSIAVFNDPTSAPAPGAITDTCTPTSIAAAVFGISSDNPDTAADESGFLVRTNPSTPGHYVFRAFARSMRDADNDGIGNPLDTCPFDVNEGDPRVFGSGDNDNDGIDNVCDPEPNVANTDQDDDVYLNRGDNCPLVANPDQADVDTDDIGDACDLVGAGGIGQGPDTPDGDPIVVTAEEDVDIICAPPPSPTPTPTPPVGGMVQIQVGGSSSAVGSVADSSGGSSSRNYIAIAGLAAPALVILIVGASYGRRRWLR